MHYVDFSTNRPVLQLYNPQDRQGVAPGFTWGYLVRTASNIASVVDAIHARGYVIGDLNESNFLVSDRALVTLVDCDSMQVPKAGGGGVFRCPVGKPDFTAPELQGRDFSRTDRNPTHDNFALAVMIFHLLMEGVHPYAGVWHAAGEPPQLEDRIRMGDCPYVGSGRVTPMPMALPFDVLPSPLKSLFVRCFQYGHKSPTTRPSPHEWKEALSALERNLNTCSANRRHVYPNHLQICPWCERTVYLGGFDPYPPLTGMQTPLPQKTFTVLPTAGSPSPSAPPPKQPQPWPQPLPSPAPLPLQRGRPKWVMWRWPVVLLLVVLVVTALQILVVDRMKIPQHPPAPARAAQQQTPQVTRTEVPTPTENASPPLSNPGTEGLAKQQTPVDLGPIQVTSDAGRTSPAFRPGGAKIGEPQRWDDVESTARETLRLNPNNAGAHYNLGLALGQKLDWDGSIAQLREALRLDPNNDMAHYSLGVALGKKLDWEGATGEYREALHRNPNNDMAHFNLGAMLARKGDWDGAIAEERETLRLNPNNAGAHFNLGFALANKGDLDGAMGEYREELRLDPNLPQAHYYLGQALAKKLDGDGAIAQFREALRLNPNDASVHYNLGVMLGQKLDWDGAIAEYREALRLNQNFAMTHCNLGAMLARKGDWDGAIAEEREALRLDPSNAEAHQNLGTALGSKGDVDGAIGEFREALRLNPNLSQAHDSLGVALGSKGDWDGAITEFREELRLNPSQAGAHNNLGFTLATKGDLDGAIAECREALRLNPNFAEAHDSLGFALEKKGDLRGALEEYRTATTLAPNIAEIRQRYESLLQRIRRAAPDSGTTTEPRVNPNDGWKHDWTPRATPPETLRRTSPAFGLGEARVNPKDGLKYVWIPPGTFMMGCSPGDNECEGNETPAHQVTITRGFWLGQTEVTAGAYKRFAAATGRQRPSATTHWTNDGMLRVNDNMPMNVKWDEAHDYCTWAGGRLPTEAEWEYAARGGSTEARYGSLDEVAWYNADGSLAHPVGEKRANGLGLYDVLGNAWEWVNDWYDPNYYQNSPSQDPLGPTSGPFRALRGGCFRSLPRDVRVSSRAGEPLSSWPWYVGGGFRCGGAVFAP